jgi:hypothetical protein
MSPYKLSLDFQAVNSTNYSCQAMMYSICEATREDDPSPYVHWGICSTNPLRLNKTFVDASRSEALLLSRAKSVEGATLVSEGSSFNANLPSTLATGTYRVMIATELPGRDRETFVQEKQRTIEELWQTSHANRAAKDEALARLEELQDPSFDLKTYVEARHKERSKTLAGEWLGRFGGSLRVGLSNPSSRTAQSVESGSEEESAGGVGGLYDDDDDDGDYTCYDPGACAPSVRTTQRTRTTKGTRANLHTRVQATHSYAVTTDHITNIFRFSFVVEIVEKLDESEPLDAPYRILADNENQARTACQTTDSTMRRAQASLRSHEAKLCRGYNRHVLVLGSALSTYGRHIGNHLLALAVGPLCDKLGLSGASFRPGPLALESDLSFADSYAFFKDFIEKEPRLNLLFSFLRSSFSYIPLDFLKDLLETTTSLAKPPAPILKPDPLYSPASSAGGEGGLYDSDNDDW